VWSESPGKKSEETPAKPLWLPPKNCNHEHLSRKPDHHKYTKFLKSKADLRTIHLYVNEGPRRTNFQLKLKEVEIKPKFSPHQARKKVPGEAGGTRPPGMS
jgi:hypothetical protein